ncbi:hypothetical protein [Lysinibacter sp. HNR]|uniref:hypothetical protein n=1 Tax=Lysinibacter sp. HNR TaxID=3031408 RepID=UPI0024350D0C|nr:hypothetical protein [Lysinibacter sp. HNR]WGD37626.1 hypothetical protein FrondiHNR_01530 [Lysinibacter sp. HNR]
MLWLVFIAAIITGTSALILTVVSIAIQLSSGQYSVTLNAETPVPDSFGTALINTGTFTSANLLVSDITPAAVTFLIAGRLISLLTTLTIAVSVTLLSWGNLRGHPFRPPITRSFIILGATLMIGSLLSQALNGFGGWFVAEQLNGTRNVDYYWPFSFNITTTPIIAGVIVLVIALTFETGERIQRDTEGLI